MFIFLLFFFKQNHLFFIPIEFFKIAELILLLKFLYLKMVFCIFHPSGLTLFTSSALLWRGLTIIGPILLAPFGVV